MQWPSQGQGTGKGKAQGECKSKYKGSCKCKSTIAGRFRQTIWWFSAIKIQAGVCEKTVNAGTPLFLFEKPMDILNESGVISGKSRFRLWILQSRTGSTKIQGFSPGPSLTTTTNAKHIGFSKGTVDWQDIVLHWCKSGGFRVRFWSGTRTPTMCITILQHTRASVACAGTCAHTHT